MELSKKLGKVRIPKDFLKTWDEAMIQKVFSNLYPIHIKQGLLFDRHNIYFAASPLFRELEGNEYNRAFENFDYIPEYYLLYHTESDTITAKEKTSCEYNPEV